MGSTARGPTKHQVKQLWPRWRGPRSVPCQIPSCPSRTCELQVQVSCLCWFPHHNLDILLLMQSTYLLFNWTLGAWLSAWLLISASAYMRYWMKALWWQIRQSPMWLQGKISSGTLSNIARSLSWSHFCGFPRAFLAPDFSLTTNILLYEDIAPSPSPHPTHNTPAWLFMFISPMPSLLFLLPPVYSGHLIYFLISREIFCVPLRVLLAI